MRMRLASWFMVGDEVILFFLNKRIRCTALNILLPRLTHMGGATFTIVCMIAVWILGGPGLEGLIALTASHILVHLLKKKFTRSRPYLKHEQVFVVGNPLQDFSFPSGHTTAICSIVTTLSLLSPWLPPLLIPVAMLVGLSRVYLGLHYPTDVVVGGLIGIVFAAVVHVLIAG